MNQIRKRHFPLPGQRILRSVLAVFLCFIIYFLRGRRGTPFYSIIAALQCIQPYTANMLKVGKKRITGTLVGAFWGGVVLIGSLYLSGDRSTFQDTPAYYMTLVLFAGVVLYSTVLLRITESSYFTTVVFLSIIMNHIGDANPYIFIFNRTMDTIIGVGVAVLANCLHLPRTRDRETLFVSGVDHVLFREDRNLSPFTRIQLNRFIKDGCRFSVSTKQTPATVRELTKGIGLKIPIIAMDGACLYDMEEMTYVKTVKMDEETAAGTAAFLAEKGFPYNINRVEENLLVIYTRGLKISGPPPEKGSPQDALYHLYLKKKGSPYRNYVSAEEDLTDNVLYFMVIDRAERVEALCKELEDQDFAPRIRTAFDTFDCREGEKILRIYSADASRRDMLEELRRFTGAPRSVFFGVRKGECDVVIPDGGGGNLVRELKKRYEPVSLRGWRNIFHF
jgi:hydroxymethylpyrimidine pyrophosphatase-like HAD family hydrolase